MSDDQIPGITVGALRALLEDLPDDMHVVLAADGEGNSFGPLSEVDNDFVHERGAEWEGSLHDTTQADYEADEDDVPVVVLWPVG